MFLVPTYLFSLSARAGQPLSRMCFRLGLRPIYNSVRVVGTDLDGTKLECKLLFLMHIPRRNWVNLNNSSLFSPRS